MNFWVKFKDGSAGYVEADSAEIAMAVGKEKTGKEAKSAERIPYPASPIIYQSAGDPCPPFCYTPNECVGRSSCPHRYACSE